MRLINADSLIEDFDPEHYFDWYTPSIIETINKQPTVELSVRGKWIPCSERLPEETDYPEQRFRVLASCSDGIVRNATIKSLRNTEEEHRSRGNFFTYVVWQPLPEPYTGEV